MALRLSCAIRLLNSGGASRGRTGDLLHAMQALSQLSYSPMVVPTLLASAPSRDLCLTAVMS